jgi:hypothetical protein
VSTLAADPTIVDAAVARLTDMYRDKAVVLALTQTLAERFAAEDTLELDLYTNQWLDTATGELLDALGEIVGEPRYGRADDLYRVWLSARIWINRSSGTISDSYHLVRLIAGPDVAALYIPSGDAAYIFDVGNTDIEAGELYKLLDAVRPAGVRMDLHYSTTPDTSINFTLSSSSAFTQGDDVQGFADATAPGTGGILRGAL